MRKNYFALATVVAIAINMPAATASTSPTKAVASIQKVLTTKTAELKAWLAKEHQEEGVLGGTYVPQINAANQKLATALKDLSATYTPLLASADTTVSYPAQSQYAIAQAAANEENQKVVVDIKATWETALKAIDKVYEPAEYVMLDHIAVAQDALLAAKRATINASNFDSAFVTAFTFEFNRTSLNKTAKSDWTGKVTTASLNTLSKVKKASVQANALASSYNYKDPSAFNSLVGTTFTGGSAFKKHISSAKALFSSAKG